MSLRAVFPLIYQKEISAYYNFRTNIYLPAIDTVFFSNTSVGNHTELEQVAISPNEILERTSWHQPRIRQNMEGQKDVRIADKTYNKYVLHLLYA